MTDPSRLVDAYLDGTLSQEALEQLEQDLANNPKYADAFAAAMMINELLCERYEHESIAKALQLVDGSFISEIDLKQLQDDYDRANPEAVVLTDPKLVRTGSAKSKRNEHLCFTEAASAIAYILQEMVRAKPKPFIAAAVAALLLVTLWLVSPFGQTDPLAPDFANTPGTTDTTQAPGKRDTATQPVATLTAVHNAQWAGPASSAPARGDALHPNQRLALTAGFAEITTNRGAIAILQAPATIELLDNDNAIELHSGKLVGICEIESSKGFLVRTPHIDITDLGTRFGVDASAQDATELHVFEGEVSVVQPASNAPPQRIDQGRAVRALAYGQVVAITSAPERFTQRPGVYRLFGTGYQLAEGVIDPDWLIVADGKGPLDQPVPLIVQYGERPDNHYTAPISDPDRAQSLVYAPSYQLYARRHDQPVLDERLLTIRSRFDLDETIDLQGLALYLEYHTPGLGELRINGQPVEPLPKDRNQHRLRGIPHKAEVALDTTVLRPGENVVEIDLPKPRVSTQAPPSISVYAELRPLSAPSDPTTGETRP